MTPHETTAAAGRAAEAIRFLNHATRPSVAHSDDLDVVGIYDLLGELALMVSRLPQLLGQIEAVLDRLVEHDQMLVVDGRHYGDPVAVAAVAGHWLTTAQAAADQLGHRLDQAHQVIAHAAATHVRPSSSQPPFLDR